MTKTLCSKNPTTQHSQQTQQHSSNPLKKNINFIQLQHFACSNVHPHLHTHHTHPTKPNNKPLYDLPIIELHTPPSLTNPTSDQQTTTRTTNWWIMYLNHNLGRTTTNNLSSLQPAPTWIHPPSFNQSTKTPTRQTIATPTMTTKKNKAQLQTIRQTPLQVGSQA